MPGKSTVVLFVHGANQVEKTEAQNRKTWEDAFDVTDHAKKVLEVVNGDENARIQTYHDQKHSGTNFPQYAGWTSLWYGDIWAGIANEIDPFLTRLNEYDEANDERLSILERIERGAMKKHFDELVPFYELAVMKADGRTLYEAICRKFLDQLESVTDGKEGYVLVGHSMGCAVSYNVMSHISCAKNGTPYCTIQGTLSDDYKKVVSDFAQKPLECFGLLTFGNYTGYDWCQRLNNKLIFDEYRKQYVYPDAIGRWYNFWTVFGGDPYILDDMLSDDMVNDDQNKYDDIAVWRTPGTNIGHGRAAWFRRNQFAKGLVKKLSYHLYR